MKPKRKAVKGFMLDFEGVKDPMQMIDLLVLASYLRGARNGRIPVGEGREVLEMIKATFTISKGNKNK